MNVWHPACGRAQFKATLKLVLQGFFTSNGKPFYSVLIGLGIQQGSIAAGREHVVRSGPADRSWLSAFVLKDFSREAVLTAP